MRVLAIIFGWLLILVGGGCSITNIMFMSSMSGGGDLAPLLLASLAVLGIGVLIVWKT